MITSFLSSLIRVKALITILGLVAVCLLIWFLGPLIGIGEARPLESELVRIVVIAVILVGALVIAFVRHALARRANSQLINSLVESEELVSMAETQASEEVELIRERFEDAFDALKNTEIRNRSGRAYVSQLPWYIIIGPPGAGKTTILRNSGLEFPLAERLGNEAIQGVGGTRNCDWWFTDEAVLIDTAGRYSTQDVNAEVDRAAWKGFLDLLKRHRRRRPINGVLLAISLSDVLLNSELERKRHAAALKKRLQELMRAFGVRVPVYVLITKADRVAGFNEYFESLDEAGREQVWGMTLPLDGEGRLAEEFSVRYADLCERLHRGMFERLHQERDIARRCKIFSFPQEFASLQPVIAGFVNDIFRPNRYEMQPILRGIYFTSGTQEGAPIQRLLGAMSRTFGFTAGSLVPYSGRGKAFFIKKLLTDVVIEEQGLIGGNRGLERRLAMLHAAAYAATAAVVIGLGALWVGGLARGEAQASATAGAAQEVQSALAEFNRAPSLASVMPVLDASERMVAINDGDSFWSWLESFGVSATTRLAPEARAAYDRVLTGALLPRLGDQFLARLAAASRAGDTDPARLRDYLRNYLMLGEADNFDRETVMEAAQAEAEAAFPVDVERQAAMVAHIERLMDLMPHPISLNDQVIGEARGRLARVPQTDQVYARLVREARNDPSLQPLDLGRVAGADALRVVIGSEGGSATGGQVPGLFTRQGLFNYVLLNLPRIVRDEQGADWVVGGGTIEDASFQRVVADVSQRYARDYISAWQAALSDISVQPMTELARGQSVLQTLAGPDAPLLRVLDTVREHTYLPQPGGDVADASNAGGQSSLVGGAVQAVAGGAMAAALGDVPWPGNPITAAFRPLHDLSESSAGQPPAIQRVQQLFGELYGTVSSVASAPSPPAAAFQSVTQSIDRADADALARLRTDSALRPEPIRTIMRDVAAGTWSLLMEQTYRHVNRTWQRDVLPACDSALFQRFPLAGNTGEEIALQDFAEFFRPGGTIDDFFVNYVQPFVSREGGRLVQATIGGATLGMSDEALTQLRRSQLVTSAFFPDGGSAPAVSFSITPVALDSRALRATFTLDDQSVVYRHEPPRPRDLQWPSRAESSNAAVSVTLIDGTSFSVERSGIWALFRLFRDGGLSQVAADRYRMTIANQQGVGVSYELRAASVSNPFSPGLLSSFRCPATL